MTDWDAINWAGDPVADEAGAREAWLRRQKNLDRGWHDGGWRDPARRNLTAAEALAELEDSVLDGYQRAAEARRLGSARASRAGALNMTGPEALLRLVELQFEHSYGAG